MQRFKEMKETQKRRHDDADNGGTSCVLSLSLFVLWVLGRGCVLQDAHSLYVSDRSIATLCSAYV